MSFETVINKVTSDFDDVLRLEGNDLILDIYTFDDTDKFKVGDKIEYRFFDGSVPETFPKNGTIMNGRVMGYIEEWVQVSFGGLIGAFKDSEGRYSEGDNFSIWFNKQS